MTISAARPARIALILAFALIPLVLADSVYPAEREADHPTFSLPRERAELFIALLKRRAQRIVEQYRAPPPPPWGGSMGLSAGYETNVDLDSSRRGDYFLEESASLLFRRPFQPWLEAELEYIGTGSQYLELTDADLWAHTVSGLFQIQPHRRIRLDLGGELGIFNFPLHSDSSFLDRRAKVELRMAHTSWLTHRLGWTYQAREYDTRGARDSAGNRLAGLNREDQRHTLLYEWQMRFAKTAIRLAAEWYRNFSNEQLQEFYDWEDVRLRTVWTQVLNARWLGVVTASVERKNYQSRSVPAIDIAERDNLYTVAGSLICRMDRRWRVSYTVTYRYQDSNDPRLDFTDWIHQVGVTVSF